MARLNEPQESQDIDSLKRRFLRQNKDLARSNSTLLQRIRNLENETSKILTDNLNLREQLGRAQRISECAGDIKSQLEAKMLELGALITGIGNESMARRKSHTGGNTARRSPGASPEQKNCKTMCTLSEVHGQEGRLPPILENKYYPRRTIEREEILAIAESPDDIGPPPVSQFVEEDPVKIDLPKRSKKEVCEDKPAAVPTLPANLEQRRKRKDSTVPLELERMNKAEDLRPTRDESSCLKMGSKRKLSVREDEEVSTRSGASSPDDFKYTRVVGGGDDRSKKPISENMPRKATKETDCKNGGVKEKDQITTITATRRILAPKSVNDSPKKVAQVLEDKKPGKGDIIKPHMVKDNSKDRKQDPIKILPPSVPSIETIEVQIEPETPVDADTLSPESAQPTERVESRDTPPPTDLVTEADGQRPSRRVRGAVSYAEPNLRDKMRRPTKELVDAVGKDGKPPREHVIKVEGEISQEPVIKPELEADVAWNEIPVAPSTTVQNNTLGCKTSSNELLPSNITTHRRRRESLLNKVDLDSARPGSATAIATLLAETRKAKAAAREKAAAEKVEDGELAVIKDLAALDIYEFKGSSPAEQITKQAAVAGKVAVPRLSRRQSAAPHRGPSPDDGATSDMEVPKKQDSSSSNRRQSTLGLRSSSATSLHHVDQEAGKSLKRSTSTTSMLDPAATGSRNDRIAARRRSMML